MLMSHVVGVRALPYMALAALLDAPARLTVPRALPGGFLALCRAIPVRACGVSGVQRGSPSAGLEAAAPMSPGHLAPAAQQQLEVALRNLLQG